MSATQDIAALFSSISGRYDFLNHLLSLNIDRKWRKKLVGLSSSPADARILDICTGTGDIVIEFAKNNSSSQCFGIDLSEEMLAIAQRKIGKAGLNRRIRLMQADAMDIPFDEGFFDAVFIGFGLRNLPDCTKGIQETIRVLRKGGKVFILEFSPRQNGLTGWFYKIYLKFVVPVIGGYISGDSGAYRYLAGSISNFLKHEKVTGLMKAQGYTDIKATPLTGGIAYIYEGTK